MAGNGAGDMTGYGATGAAGGGADAALAAQGYGATLWTPRPETIASARISHYARWLADRGITAGDPGAAGDAEAARRRYAALWQWSVDRPGEFWDSVWEYFGVLGERGHGPALAEAVMPGARWFPGATLNYARNALRAAKADPGRTAVIAYSERGRGGCLTYGELEAEVARVAAGLKALGVTKGDRVAALVPNVPQAIVALLATASIGAIWSSCSPDFGARSVVDRFAQIEPKVLIAATGYEYNGRAFDRLATVAEIAAALPGLAAVVVLGEDSGLRPGQGVALRAWEELGGGTGTGQPPDLEFEPVPFGHPLWVVYSSGTTGLPKPIVHGHGGIVLEHLKALCLHMDIHPGDRFAWYTTTGWMMWNFLAGGLLAGATILTYDGSATFPRTGRLWEVAADERLTYLGVGAPYLMACRKAGLRPGETGDLSALRAVGSTGSPLPPEGFGWCYEAVGKDLLLGSFSGGTDVCTGFVGPNPLLPVRSGIISGRCLGADVRAFDEDGREVTGQVGELVITTPMPSMPVGFWNDPGGRRYADSYFADYPGVWRHGDWIEILPDGGCVIFGRSDATLNRGGVRMGTAEFYRVVESFPEVADSLVVDTGRLGKEGRLVLFVTLVTPAGAGAESGREVPGDSNVEAGLARRIRAALRTQLSPRHVPDEIVWVPGIPRTLSGKKLEIPVRKILLGTPVADAADPSALANPEVLRFYVPKDLHASDRRNGAAARPSRAHDEVGTATRMESQVMPERAGEAMRPASDGVMQSASDEARNTALAKAAALWPDAGAGGAAAPPGGPGFLYAYYHFAASEDLVPAGPERVARTAASHALLGSVRPQGRAAVQVRDGGEASLTGAATVADIVTDDMPYLVDSLTMELNRHKADIRLIVHPLLTVHRDVAGTVRGAILPLGTGPGAGPGERPAPASRGDAVRESWIHVELSQVSDQAALAADLRRVLDDVRVANEDQRRMRAAARELVTVLTDAGGPKESEAGELLAWMAAGHFTFLGYRRYQFSGAQRRPVPGSGLGILRHDFADDEHQVMPRLDGDRPRLLGLAKSSIRSTVYRPSYLDYVGVREFDPQTGEITGEHRFLGLYTQAAFTESITQIPVLRRKLDAVLEAAGLPPDSHDGKRLAEILEGYPREELFEMSPGQLTPIALAVLRLGERKQVRLFLRPDAYGRYMSCLIYLPRDRYTTQVRLRAQEILREALDGAGVDYSAMIGNSALARLHVVVHARPGAVMPEPDAAALQARIAAAVRSWDEDLAAEAERQLGPERAARLLRECARGIPESYKSDKTPQQAVADLSEILRLRESAAPFGLRLFIEPNGPWRLLVYRIESPITLSAVLPQLQHMGLEVVDEHPHEFPGCWVYEFGLRPQEMPQSPEAAKANFEEALTALWQQRCEDDGFNALVLDACLTWRQVVMLRAYARYLRQIGTRFSQDYIQRALRANPSISRLLVRLFESRFDPAMVTGSAERDEAIAEELRGELDEVTSLDHDRILRSYLSLIEATVRTNYFQSGSWTAAASGAAETWYVDAPYLAFKLTPGGVAEVPLPRPKFEIFVYSPRFEAVHLRFGAVARGGLRWSERPEDFRTEILGLVKAQEVKNSVIVPSGAKGGFVCKRLPDPAAREAYQAEVLGCYRAFISAMLDITDNLSGDAVVPPRDVVRLDGDDPYLVVAADKGTATFSDVANEIAQRYGFWLGDAFASGGSEGYDHKKMGITARGAWESVRWHFAALGLDPDKDDFTVAGIGDMSGDVFGNGMLLSRRIKLVAAFDHRHVFVDPDPDPAASFAERQRLFALDRSSWDDYDRALISAGGGVWPRSAKSVPVSPQARAALGIDESVAALSPDELINAILKAPVDLLWNGGIGTYVKASTQAHADAGDRSNDAVRVNAPELRARVIAEGGNLGLTQAARVEYALAGGLVNTDFIDNSAGVDTSDHEVNIKILLAGAIEERKRGALLHEMTDEVAAHVLRHNDGQNMALTVGRYQAPRLLHVHARYLRKLERAGLVSREQDVLPDDKEIAARRNAGTGLTTPELSLLLAHTKIAAGREVLASGLPDDPALSGALAEYFPAPLRERFASRMPGHPLRREIITTSVVNEMVDTAGSTFLFRLGEETNAPVPDITRAWLVAREVFGMREFWRQVTTLAGDCDMPARIDLVLEGRKLAERATRWLLLNRRQPFGIGETVRALREPVATVRSGIPKLLAGRDLEGFEERRATFRERGVPAPLADEVAAMVPSYSAFDIVHSAELAGRGVEETAAVYFALADRLQLGRLRDLIVALPRDDRWASMARGALRDDLYGAHAALTRDVLAAGGDGTAAERVAAWEAANASAVSRVAATLAEIWESDRFTFTTLSVAVRVIRTLVSV
jgi:glutamate dehydrogenase